MDASRLFATAQRIVAQAITTSGTRVRAYTETVTTTPGTLAQARVTSTVYEGPMIVTVALQGGAGASDFLPGVEIRPGAWMVSALPAVPDLEVGTMLEVVRCRDRKLVTRRAKVLACVRDSSGAVVKIVASPEPLA